MKNISDYFASIIIPVYNGSAFIIETLCSVQQQTHKNWECIIVDDGSTDDTATVVQKYIATDNRFQYIHQANKGLSGARNTGIENSKGEVIQFLDADDVILPSKIEKQILNHFLPVNKSTSIISYTDYYAGFSSDIYKKSPPYLPAQFLTNHFLTELIKRWETTLSIPPHCFLFSADIFKIQNIRFDEEIPNHEDFDCWVRIIQSGAQVKYLDEKLCIYRITDGSMSKNMKGMSEGFLKAIDKHIHTQGYSKKVHTILIKKRRQILGSYRRFDLMTWKDKLLSFKVFRKYYADRIMQKIGMGK